MALRRVTGQADGSPEAENKVEDENETAVSIFLNAAGRFSIRLIHKTVATSLQ